MDPGLEPCLLEAWSRKPHLYTHSSMAGARREGSDLGMMYARVRGRSKDGQVGCGGGL